MSFVMKIRKKKEKEKETKTTTTFEDSIKAKAKLNLLEERYKLLMGMIADGEDRERLNGLLDLLKLQVIATQGLGEVGDKARPSNKAVEGFQELLEMYMLDLLEYGKDSEVCKVDEALILGGLTNLMNRSLRREHTNVEIVTIPPELFLPSWILRASRESSLAT